MEGMPCCMAAIQGIYEVEGFEKIFNIGGGREGVGEKEKGVRYVSLSFFSCRIQVGGVLCCVLLLGHCHLISSGGKLDRLGRLHEIELGSKVGLDGPSP